MFAGGFKGVWGSVAERGRKLFRISQGSIARNTLEILARDLLSAGGEANNMARAEAIVAQYEKSSKEKKASFHLFLAQNFHPDSKRLQLAAEAYLTAPSQETIADLTRAAEPPRRELLQRLNVAPGATALLLEMRKTMLAETGEAGNLKPLELDLRHLLGAWFNRGFLQLRRIAWSSPATVLEKIIAYEAVHEIDGWDDLRRRLAADRRCFAFFHPSLPDEPLIFVEVALCQGLASEIGSLLSAKTPAPSSLNPDTAIFYSISNCQAGLKGIALGNFLIRQVVDELRAELPSLKRFATLSPVPSFRNWLQCQLRANGQSVLLPEERARLSDFVACDKAKLETMDVADKTMLQRLLAVHLTARNDGAGPEDPVARFHLRNGARLERINGSANLSRRGMAESLGLMVNYVYEPETIESNHVRFVTEGRVAHSAPVAELLKRKSHAAAKAVDQTAQA